MASALGDTIEFDPSPSASAKTFTSMVSHLFLTHYQLFNSHAEVAAQSYTVDTMPRQQVDSIEFVDDDFQTPPVPEFQESKSNQSLRHYGNINKVLDIHNEGMSLVDKIMQIWPPRPWVNEDEVASLLHGCTLDTVPFMRAFYRKVIKQLDAAAIAGKALKWPPSTDYKDELPSYEMLDAVRILGGQREGFGCFPSTIMKRLEAAKLRFLLLSPDNGARQKAIAPFWTTRVERDYPATQATSQGGRPDARKVFSMLDDSGSVDSATSTVASIKGCEYRSEHDHSDDAHFQHHHDPYEMIVSESDHDSSPIVRSRRTSKFTHIESDENDDEDEAGDMRHAGDVERANTQPEFDLDNDRVTSMLGSLLDTDDFHEILTHTIMQATHSYHIPQLTKHTDKLLESHSFKEKLANMIHEKVADLHSNVAAAFDKLAKQQSEIDQLKRQIEAMKRESPAPVFGGSSKSWAPPFGKHSPGVFTIDRKGTSPSAPSDGAQPSSRVMSSFDPRRRGSLRHQKQGETSSDFVVGGGVVDNENSSLLSGSQGRGTEKRRATSSPIAGNRRDSKVYH
ncbi:hypothetical protein BKA67DRAFT_150721 [Truncatella angustata]|uniref:Uncharacterized protein n=1 Tax=Truncatella angustata TaxID=152316 RepID=A0A9P8UQK5_9PEZI|nr:uncharacterized protein BKA67DRAFT_150721 [Truncatella angustata]KAH6656287.1 hypothetical protein BKA67DRAFT_150721 [Truncatella angustata]KAH8202147.1 hypothetical protein TruAng_003725 [Truncatella angustata]